MTFPDAFREHVAPKLRQMIREGAIQCAAGLADFADVTDEVMRKAYRLGALRLPDDILYDLEQWVLTAAVEDIEACERLLTPGPDVISWCDAIVQGITHAGARAVVQHDLEGQHPEYRTICRERRRDALTQRAVASVWSANG